MPLLEVHGLSKRFGGFVALSDVGLHLDPGERLDESARNSRVRAALEGLDPHHRQVLEIAYFQGLSQSRIAERLQTPLGTVKSWTQQGLSRLRSVLSPEDVP